VAGEFWIPLVDEPIGELVFEIESEQPEIRELVNTPQHLLTFRTFAYIRVGILLGRVLMERDEELNEGEETWVDALVRDPEVRAELVQAVKDVAEEVAAEHTGEEGAGPDEAARARFRAFAERALEDV
jgi:hypothetical protein